MNCAYNGQKGTFALYYWRACTEGPFHPECERTATADGFESGCYYDRGSDYTTCDEQDPARLNQRAAERGARGYTVAMQFWPAPTA